MGSAAFFLRSWEILTTANVAGRTTRRRSKEKIAGRFFLEVKKEMIFLILWAIIF